MTEALRRHIAAFHRTCASASRDARILDWICACQTKALGGRLVECACGWSSSVYNSCCNRHCPQCRGGVRARWLTDRLDHLLPVPHFQVVFTFPGVLRELAHDNPGVVYGAMFVAAADTLRTLGEQRLGVRLGVLEVLHTWNRELLLHPHIHCLVTAGGLTPEGTWRPSRPHFLFPQRVMAAMYRGKVVEALRTAHADGDLVLRSAAPDALASLLAKAHRHRWVVHVEPPDDRPVEHAAKYLAKYVAGGPISDERIIAITNAEVTFRGRDKVVTVDGPEFIRRFTQHFLPPRFKRTRYYGLYSNTDRRTRLPIARAALGTPEPAPKPVVAVRTRTCPRCGQPVRERSIPGLRFCRPLRPPQARGPPTP